MAKTFRNTELYVGGFYHQLVKQWRPVIELRHTATAFELRMILANPLLDAVRKSYNREQFRCAFFESKSTAPLYTFLWKFGKLGWIPTSYFWKYCDDEPLTECRHYFFGIHIVDANTGILVDYRQERLSERFSRLVYQRISAQRNSSMCVKSAMVRCLAWDYPASVQDKLANLLAGMEYSEYLVPKMRIDTAAVALDAAIVEPLADCSLSLPNPSVEGQ